MERFEVLNVAGEGSFGRVYKARRRDTDEIVAFKVIQKRGRSEKELEGLRQECEIQRHLHHPNIIQMLESFETDNEIVVVSEFADRQLYELLGAAGYLPEARVQQITCDLVAALFYLHSNRVLHRDLKPQNILLGNDGTAKLCDFGFARSMSCNTMLLTSIKGTPLYMAPELVTESPYDHNADLWSLGCIVYELLVGRPPFSTTSILALVHLIKNEQIRFPEFVSPNCVSFLQGLLQKDLSKRLTWPYLLQHPFLQGKVVIPKNQATTIPAFTNALSDSQQKVKERQRQHLTELSKQTKQASQTNHLLEEFEKRQQLQRKQVSQGTDCQGGCSGVSKECQTNVSDTPLSPNKTPTPCLSNDLKNSNPERNDIRRSRDKPAKVHHSSSDSDNSGTESAKQCQPEWKDPNPSQNEEWLDYLQRSMEEVMSGDLSCLLKPPLVAVATAPLSRKNASPQVIEYVACLLSLPFANETVNSEVMATIISTYLESKIVGQLLQGARTLVTNRSTGQLTSMGHLRAEQLLALERVCMLLSHLVHQQPATLADSFTKQLCEGLQGRHEGAALLHHLLGLGKRKGRVVADILAVLEQVGRNPQNAALLQQAALGGDKAVDFASLVSHSNDLVRARSCVVLRLLAQHCPESLGAAWPPTLADRLETLRQDADHPHIQQVASDAIRVLSKLPCFSAMSCTG